MSCFRSDEVGEFISGIFGYAQKSGGMEHVAGLLFFKVYVPDWFPDVESEF